MAEQNLSERIITVAITIAVTAAIGALGTILAGGALIDHLQGATDKELQAARAELEERIRKLEDAPSSTQQISLPEGAVIAIDSTRLSDENTCPPGWLPFKEGRARVIVGAGSPGEAPGKMAFDEKGELLVGYVIRQHGGEQQHQLVDDELPAHNHGLRDAMDNDPVGWGKQPASHPLPTMVTGSGKTPRYARELTVGKNAAHNNMPPYIALYFCKYTGVRR